MESHNTSSSYAISLEEPEERGWLHHLKAHGYVVVKGVVSSDEVSHAKSLIWDWLENLGSGIKRDDPRTWRDSNWPGSMLGFMSQFGGGQMAGAWYLRGLPRVKKVFAAIWGTEELLTSMDTTIMWRPWWSNPYHNEEDWTPTVERLHCDQNPVRKVGFHCVQGMIPLLPVTQQSGGLQVVPDTNTNETQDYLKQTYPGTSRGFDWCELRPSDKFIGTGTLLEAEPGDLILWDSRVIHGGLVGTGKKSEDPPPAELARLSLTVCMSPSSKATPRALEQRRMAVEKGWTLTHWPHEFNKSSMSTVNGNNIKNYIYKPPVLNEEQWKLVG